MKSITARQLASKLGVSAAAVSMALNGKPGVSDQTRALVRSEAAKLGYVLPKLRQGNQQTKNLSFVVFKGIGAAEQTTFSTFVLRGLEARAKELQYRVLVHYFYADQPWNAQIDQILSDTCGVVMLGTDITAQQRDDLMPLLALGRTPLVMVDNFLFSAYVDCVGNDNTYGAKAAVSHLIDCGYRSIGYLRAKQRIVNFDDRELGVRLSLSENGACGLAPLQVIDADVSADKAREDAAAWLRAGNKPAQAFFCENDVLAAAFLHALKDGGYRVPEDVALIGFDDVEICEMVDPPMTTMHVFKEHIGRIAAQLLHARILAGDTIRSSGESGLLKVALSARLKERKSVSRRN